MRALWLLPKAAPALFRHMAAYAELAALDLIRAKREFTSLALAAVLLAVSLQFVLLLGCAGVIAATWDGPYRVTAIAWLGGGFLVVAVGAALYAASLARATSPFMADIRREWLDDRVLLERILSPDEE